MSILEIFLIGVGLSMDAVAVSMTNGMVYRKRGWSQKIWMPIYFGLFQFLMSVLGYYASVFLADVIRRYAGLVIFVILGVIGGKMIRDGIQDPGGEETKVDLTHKILFFQAIATSIDAFAVGIGFQAMQIPAVCPSLLIGATTFGLSFAAIWVGEKFGTMLENKAQILGGAILILIGIKSLLS